MKGSDEDLVKNILQNTALLGFWLLSHLNSHEESCASQEVSVPEQTPEDKQDIKKTERNLVPKEGLKPEFFDVFLLHVGDAKVIIARAIRTETDLSLKEIMKRIEEAPEVPMFQGVRFSEAQRLLGILNNVGAVVAIKAS